MVRATTLGLLVATAACNSVFGLVETESIEPDDFDSDDGVLDIADIVERKLGEPIEALAAMHPGVGVARVAEVITVGVGLIVVRDLRAVVTAVEQRVAVLVAVRAGRARIARVADAIGVAVVFHRIGDEVTST